MGWEQGSLHSCLKYSCAIWARFVTRCTLLTFVLAIVAFTLVCSDVIYRLNDLIESDYRQNFYPDVSQTDSIRLSSNFPVSGQSFFSKWCSIRETFWLALRNPRN